MLAKNWCKNGNIQHIHHHRNSGIPPVVPRLAYDGGSGPAVPPYPNPEDTTACGGAEPNMPVPLVPVLEPPSQFTVDGPDIELNTLSSSASAEYLSTAVVTGVATVTFDLAPGWKGWSGIALGAVDQEDGVDCGCCWVRPGKMEKAGNFR